MSKAERVEPRVYYYYDCILCGWQGYGGANLRLCGLCRQESLTRLDNS